MDMSIVKEFVKLDDKYSYRNTINIPSSVYHTI